MVTKYSNKFITLEFFTNAMYEKEGVYFSIVQGKRVDYSPRRINSLLGLPVLEVCDVERRRIAHNWPEGQHAWNELLVGLMKEGKWWI